uniref:Uncharacterized protein n=1 Tax=Electrophorus electricus TaxID=8005 RepID=A0A4W4DYK6_ELEEL
MPDDISEKINFTATPINMSPRAHSMRPNISREKPKPTPDRKSSKPIMEKRRRARINSSLCQLKTLILDALKKDTSRHSKLEKADILELTVKHLKNVQHAQMTGEYARFSYPALGKYRAGFSACMNEVTRFMSTCEGASGEFGARLIAHLASCVSQTSVPTQQHTSACAPHSAVGRASPQLIVQTSNGAFALLIPSSPGFNFSVQHSSSRPVALCPSRIHEDAIAKRIPRGKPATSLSDGRELQKEDGKSRAVVHYYYYFL